MALTILGGLRNLSDGSDGGGDPQVDKAVFKICVFFCCVGVGGFVATFFWALTRPDHFWLSLGVGSLIIVSSALVGGIVGMLFGIPKSIADPARALATPPPQPGQGDAPQNGMQTLSTNTNLEEISDWLTKIIVGVGLTEARQIMGFFNTATKRLGASFLVNNPETVDSLAAIAGCMVVFGLTVGFLLGYLLTRLFLARAFNLIEQDLRTRVQQLQAKVVETKKTNEEVSQHKDKIYSLLYQYDSQGFRQAIDQLHALLDQDINKSNASLWTYLACANGQAYRWGKEHGDTDNARIKKYRDEALDAVSQTLKYDTDGWKKALQLAWDKYYPTKLGNGPDKDENDLEVFYDDDDFEKLLGPKSSKPQ